MVVCERGRGDDEVGGRDLVAGGLEFGVERSQDARDPLVIRQDGDLAEYPFDPSFSPVPRDRVLSAVDAVEQLAPTVTTDRKESSYGLLSASAIGASPRSAAMHTLESISSPKARSGTRRPRGGHARPPRCRQRKRDRAAGP
jgi:hypothetical protein